MSSDNPARVAADVASLLPMSDPLAQIARRRLDDLVREERSLIVKITAPAPGATGTTDFGPTRLTFKDGVAEHKGPLAPGLRLYLEQNGYGIGSEPATPPAETPAVVDLNGQPAGDSRDVPGPHPMQIADAAVRTIDGVPHWRSGGQWVPVGKGAGELGTPLVDASVTPERAPADALALPANAGDADPHGADVVAFEVGSPERAVAIARARYPEGAPQREAAEAVLEATRAKSEGNA